MNEMNLSMRLQAVATYILEGSTIADIGSDHAYLPCFTCREGITPFAIAGELNEGPFESAKAQVIKSRLEDKVFVRKGNGLKVIETGEVDCITIAGMGGQLITQILEEGKEKLLGVKRLILQPNVGAIHIRKWLLKNGWELIKENILEEDNKIYEILVATKGNPNLPYSQNESAELLMGPFLIKEKNNIFKKKWDSELHQWKRVLIQLEKAVESEELLEKKKEIEKKVSLVEEVLS